MMPAAQNALHWEALARILAGLALCPLLFGIINRVKAKFGGRTGQPLCRPITIWPDCSKRAL